MLHLILLGLRSVASASWRLNAESISPRNPEHCLGAHKDFLALGVNQDVTSSESRASTADSRRSNDAALAQDTDSEILEELKLTDCSISSSVLTSSARAPSDTELSQQDWVALLENLSVRDSRVSHVNLNSILSVPSGTGSSTTTRKN